MYTKHTVYKTSDGSIFETERDAMRYVAKCKVEAEFARISVGAECDAEYEYSPKLVLALLLKHAETMAPLLTDYADLLGDA